MRNKRLPNRFIKIQNKLERVIEKLSALGTSKTSSLSYDELVNLIERNTELELFLYYKYNLFLVERAYDLCYAISNREREPFFGYEPSSDLNMWIQELEGFFGEAIEEAVETIASRFVDRIVREYQEDSLEESKLTEEELKERLLAKTKTEEFWYEVSQYLMMSCPEGINRNLLLMSRIFPFEAFLEKVAMNPSEFFSAAEINYIREELGNKEETPQTKDVSTFDGKE